MVSMYQLTLSQVWAIRKDTGDQEQAGKLKQDYIVQIGLYVDALIRLGFLKRNLR